jgi:putative aldouronate transport system substrate-binding protein
MKKIFVLALALFSAGLAFASPSQQAPGASSSVPTLIWWMIGGTPQPDLADSAKIISDYTESKIGVRVEFRIASWGEASTRFNTILNSGEYYDIMFVDGGSYNQRVALGAYADISDLVRTESPALWNYIPSSLWDGVKVGGKIYSVPTYKDSAMTVFGYWDKAYVDKYRLNIKDTMSWADIDSALRQIKAGEGTRFYPLLRTKGDNPFVFDWYDNLTTGLAVLGVRLDDANLKVVNTLEQPDIVQNLNYIHRWYTDGIINPDANLVDEVAPNKAFFLAQAWPSVRFSYATSNGVKEYLPSKFFGPSYSTGSIQGSMNAVSSQSRYKAQALKLIQLANTDVKFRDMLGYGLEGTHFTYVNNGTAVHRNTSRPWSLTNYQEATFFIETPEDNVPAGYWDEVRQLNEQGTRAATLGFIMNLAPVQNQIANCNTVWTKYRTDLVTGVSDPATVLPQVIAELKANGYDLIVAEAQRQIDAWKASR